MKNLLQFILLNKLDINKICNIYTLFDSHDLDLIIEEIISTAYNGSYSKFKLEKIMDCSNLNFDQIKIIDQLVKNKYKNWQQEFYCLLLGNLNISKEVKEAFINQSIKEHVFK